VGSESKAMRESSSGASVCSRKKIEGISESQARIGRFTGGVTEKSGDSSGGNSRKKNPDREKKMVGSDRKNSTPGAGNLPLIRGKFKILVIPRHILFLYPGILRERLH